MNRRAFFKFGLSAVAGVALAEAIPFGRVWSFPSKIVVANRSSMKSPQQQWNQFAER